MKSVTSRICLNKTIDFDLFWKTENQPFCLEGDKSGCTLTKEPAGKQEKSEADFTVTGWICEFSDTFS